MHSLVLRFFSGPLSDARLLLFAKRRRDTPAGLASPGHLEGCHNTLLFITLPHESVLDCHSRGAMHRLHENQS